MAAVKRSLRLFGGGAIGWCRRSGEGGVGACGVKVVHVVPGIIYFHSDGRLRRLFQKTFTPSPKTSVHFVPGIFVPRPPAPAALRLFVMKSPRPTGRVEDSR
jgi:hypothetical protein